MARTAGSDGERTEAAIRHAAVDLIARHGYEAVSMRQLAAVVGVQAAALYRYFPNKEALLFSLMESHMRELAESWEGTRPSSPDPTRLLAAFVEHHIRFHVARRHATHVSNMELRSLSKDRLSTIIKMRSAYEKELRSILREGSDAGVFAIGDAGLTAMAILQMITGVIVWFRPGARLSVEDVAKTYLAMTMRLVGRREEADVPEHA